jgi:hypothetical protein
MHWKGQMSKAYFRNDPQKNHHHYKYNFQISSIITCHDVVELSKNSGKSSTSGQKSKCQQIICHQAPIKQKHSLVRYNRYHKQERNQITSAVDLTPLFVYSTGPNWEVQDIILIDKILRLDSEQILR